MTNSSFPPSLPSDNASIKHDHDHDHANALVSTCRTTLVHEEYAEEEAHETMEAVRSGVMAEIKEQSLSAKAKQYAARRAREMLSCMVEVHFLNRDEGEPDLGGDTLWQVDEEPPCSEPDSWARGCQ